MPLNPQRFVAENTRLKPVPRVPAISLHTAHEATGLWRLSAVDEGSDPPPPYWAFPWAGGMALARHILERPETVSGRRVFDLGSGSGLVAIAAARAGARSVKATEIDPYAIAAIALNAAANRVTIDIVAADVTGGPAPEADVVTVGDLFYERDLARGVLGYLDRCLAVGIDVLVGDPGRTYAPRSRLVRIADYEVPDVGEVEGTSHGRAAVFRLAGP